MELTTPLCFLVGPTACRLAALETDYRAPGTYNRHRHAYLETHWVTAGRCGFLAGHESVSVGPGEFLAIAPELYHSIKAATPDLQMLSFGLALDGGGREAPLERLRQLRWTRLEAGEDARLFSMLRTAAFDEAFFREGCKARLALYLLRLAQSAPPSPPRAPDAGREGRDAQAIEEFFNRNYAMKRGKEALAGRLAVSVRQLDRILRKSCGMSYREKRNEIRLEIARDLLETTEERVEEIAAFLGYESASNFTAFIKKRTGMTPSELRARRG
ncbi:MAG: AraC family transcriptional regulator [Oscillospiraceae bacterium]|nr:AraC family transcriptional regulator [Oscillospiraceae bacterium]